ncbi:MAG: sigma-54-dependent Fis family transcriptional regulator [Bacteroidales bacterium]|jgi:transcriptional regulator with PAS, ATPase and Fis domain|nr:sigma-54-dependent Fis family transcriptional regulator [Bacteroidales bacterium]
MNADVIQAQHEFGIIGTCPELLQAISTAVQAAPYDVNVLILGENGAGKEDFHKIIHRYSSRSSKKCIAINCGALPEGTINSELFGHTKGSFTGAIADHAGYFEVANGGTIFLDEVGELPLDTQARLLRVLESGEFQRMGSSEVKKTDVRIVAATNRNLLKAIEQGKFREDLYYRLSTIIIRVPPLRSRGKDIYLLFRKFSSDFASRYRKERITLTPEAQRALEAYSWPGNVRQLRHLVEELCITEDERPVGEEVLRRHLPEFESRVTVGDADQHNDDMFKPGEKAFLYQLLFNMQNQLNEVRQKLGLSDVTSAPTPTNSHALAPAGDGQGIGRPYKKQDDDFEEQEAVEVEMDESASADEKPSATQPLSKRDRERAAIVESLQRNGGNKRKAAEELGISERTIHRKIIEYGLTDKSKA